MRLFDDAKSNLSAFLSLQKEYPEYNDLIEDLMRVNTQLIQYSQELKKIVDKK